MMLSNSMEQSDLKFGVFFWRVSASHIITYFIIGLIASLMLDYKTSFENPPLSYFMKPVESSWVALGPVLQIFRGLVFSIALWFFKDGFINTSLGWLKLWLLIVGLSILSTTGPAPGSIEGIIYTKIPLITQLKAYLEVVPQTMLFSLCVYYWYQNPKRIWNILSIVLISMISILSLLGFLDAYLK